MNIPTEEQEQIALMEWAKLYEPDYPALKLLFHIPNGGKKKPTGGGAVQKGGR